MPEIYACPAIEAGDRARVVADATEDEIAALMRHTDTVAEILNTLRQGVALTLERIEAVSTQESTRRPHETPIDRS